MNLSRNMVYDHQQELKPSRRWLAEADAPRAQTLAAVDRIIPWGELVAMVRPCFAKDRTKAKGGRPGFSLEMLLRVFALSLLWRASFRGLAGSLADSASMSAFIGSPIARRTPSASRLREFFAFMSRTVPEGEVLNLTDLVAFRIREAITDAGLAYVPGRIDEPQFRSIATNHPPPGPGGGGSAAGTESLEATT